MRNAAMTTNVIRILGNSLALYVAVRLVPGFIVSGGVYEYLIAGVVLGLLNLIVKPILKAISMPLVILTLGLFTLIINGLLVLGVDYLFDFVTISSLASLFWAVIIVSIINIFVSMIAKIAD